MMLSKMLHSFAFLSFSLPIALNAMPGENDLVITYDISPRKKHMLFQEVVRDTIPGRKCPADCVILGIVKDVKDELDYRLLRNHLNAISLNHLSETTFTPTLAKKYVVNRTPENSPIVLVPKPEEVAKLKNLNTALQTAVQEYNTLKGKQYRVHDDFNSETFDPHIPLIDASAIQDGALDRDVIINRLNTQINQNGNNLELLHERNRPLSSYVPQHRGCAPMHRQAPQLGRPVAPRLRPVPQLRRHAAPGVRHAAPQLRRDAAPGVRHAAPQLRRHAAPGVKKAPHRRHHR